MTDAVEINRINENLIATLTQKLSNLEDQIVHRFADFESRLTRMENSPGALGADRLARLEERAWAKDQTAAIELASMADLDQLRKDSDKNYAAGPAVKDVLDKHADLESRVAKLEKAGEQPAKPPTPEPGKGNSKVETGGSVKSGPVGKTTGSS